MFEALIMLALIFIVLKVFGMMVGTMTSIITGSAKFIAFLTVVSIVAFGLHSAGLF